MPEFSIVIPTRDRPRALERCLQSLTALDTPRDRFEVIVVDDGSEPPLAPSLARFDDALTLTWVRQVPSRGPAAARNLGAERARGSLLLFIDDDCTAAAGWVAAFEKADAAQADGRSLFGGRIDNALPDNPFSSASQRLISYLYAYGAVAGARFQFFCSNNMAMRTEAFRAVRGFDTGFVSAAGEDRDLCHRVAASGGHLVYVAGAVVAHAHQLGLWTFLRQHFRYGRSARRFHRLRAQRDGGNVRLESMAFYLGMVRFPFGQSDERRPFRQALLLAVSQAAYLTGVATELWSASGTGAAGEAAAR